METPPPYYPPQPKKSKVGLIVGLILGSIGLCCLGVIGFGVWAGLTGVRKIGPMVDCGLAFNDVRKAVREYANDHQGQLPAAENWQDEVRPYLAKVLKETKDQKGGIFKSLDPDGPWGCKWEAGEFTGICFNSDLSKKKLSEIQSPETTVLLYEIAKASQNAHGPYNPSRTEKAPPFLGNSRPWIKSNVEGKMDVNGRSGANFDFDFDDKSSSGSTAGSSSKSGDSSDN